jgi:hypothetical protein
MAYKHIDKTRSDLSNINNDKILKKVEKYVESKREQTSKEIVERKSKRQATIYQEGDLEVMISRISSESQPKNLKKKNYKKIIYVIYAIIILAFVIFCVKHFFM